MPYTGAYTMLNAYPYNSERLQAELTRLMHDNDTCIESNIDTDTPAHSSDLASCYTYCNQPDKRYSIILLTVSDAGNIFINNNPAYALCSMRDLITLMHSHGFTLLPHKAADCTNLPHLQHNPHGVQYIFANLSAILAGYTATPTATLPKRNYSENVNSFHSHNSSQSAARKLQLATVFGAPTPAQNYTIQYHDTAADTYYTQHFANYVQALQAYHTLQAIT